MKEKPIIFSGPMVRAILDGRKSQTRRIINPDTWNPASSEFSGRFRLGAYSDKVGLQAYFEHIDTGNWFGTKCPYDQPGGRIWVKENFAVQPELWAESHLLQPIHYLADSDPREIEDYAVKSSRFMPRWASRITLEITGIRVERLQDISEQDAIAEGIECRNVIVGSNCDSGYQYEVWEDRYFYDGCQDEILESSTDAYESLWNKLNGPGSWDKNPWVWVIEFRRIEND